MTDTPPSKPGLPDAAYISSALGRFHATELPRGPWDPAHQHGGPPVALACRAIEVAAGEHGLGHIARLTALAQRESAVELPASLPGHPFPKAPRAPDDSPPVNFPFAGKHVGYADLVETRLAQGAMWQGPCAIWFRLRYPLVQGEAPSPYARVAVAADSGNGVSAVLDIERYLYVNADLTINLLRKPVGEWICLDARTAIGPDGSGLAESALYDVRGFIGRATQSLAVRMR
ncbi:thioesterase family protein [Burkholderiaceae bacterium FT117]|uniref:thioesterase family protein n=1 Tax=Zeimonas sediminis TaxID=2944268 RepID=UPI002342C939|nr:thioesterase family protein [Zeimonas sediminis]MCM5571053.1 thioesterase family protein [Zeimonas sediminis]